MPRQARLDAPGTLHHVIIRGIERRSIVDDRKDRENFLERLEKISASTLTPTLNLIPLSDKIGLTKFLNFQGERMSTYFLKSILALLLVLLTAAGMFTMFEIFGRNEKRFNAERLKKIHRMSGVLYFLVFAIISYFCIRFIFITKTELSVRGAFHAVFAMTILVLLAVKVLYVRVYRQFYDQIKVFGLLISLMTFVMVGMSAGYYLVISEFGTDTSYDKILQYKERIARGKKEKKGEALMLPARTDPESIGRGKNIFDAKCSFCHNAYSTETIVGPGLKGVLKNPELPFSRQPATHENIRKQLKQPFGRMPSFDYLSQEEVEDIIAFLNTL